MRLQVRDYGQAFDISGYRAPDHAIPTENGYGIFPMRKFMDRVTWSRMDDGTRLVMVKGIDPGRR